MTVSSLGHERPMSVREVIEVHPAIAVPAYVAAQMVRQRMSESALYDVDDDTNVSEREADDVFPPRDCESDLDSGDEGGKFLVTLAAFVSAFLGVGVLAACAYSHEWAPVVMAVPLFALAGGLLYASQKRDN